MYEYQFVKINLGGILPQSPAPIIKKLYHLKQRKGGDLFKFSHQRPQGMEPHLILN